MNNKSFISWYLCVGKVEALCSKGNKVLLAMTNVGWLVGYIDLKGEYNISKYVSVGYVNIGFSNISKLGNGENKGINALQNYQSK